MGIRSSKSVDGFIKGLEEILNKGLASSMTIDRMAEMDDSEFDLYRSMAKSYKDFSEMSMAMAKQLDEQSEILEDLQRGIKANMLKK